MSLKKLEDFSLILAQIFSELRGTDLLDANLDKMRNCPRKQCAVNLYWGACNRFFELVPIYRSSNKC